MVTPLRQLPPPGHPVPLPLTEPPPVPPGISTISDPQLRLHAEDAWRTVIRLGNLLRLWQHFLLLRELRLSIDAETQARITAPFPELAGVKVALDALASLPPDAPCVLRPFPVAEVLEVVGAFRVAVGKCVLGLGSVPLDTALFRPPEADRFAALFNVDGDLTGHSPQFTFHAAPCDPIHMEIEVAKLRAALETVPAAALAVPRPEGTHPVTGAAAPATPSPGGPGLTLVVTEGDRSFVVRRPEGQPFSIPAADVAVFALFTQKVSSGVPDETVQFGPLNRAADPADKQAPTTEASPRLRKAIQRINGWFRHQFGSPPGGRAWIEAVRGHGYKLMAGVNWEAGKHQKQKSRSVYAHSTDPVVLSECQPAQGVKVQSQGGRSGRKREEREDN